MTDLIPYRHERLEYTIISSIMQGKPPADTDDLQVPASVKMILGRCWSTLPMTRPTMLWCENSLAREINKLKVLFS